MKGLSKEIELGTHCDVADDIAHLLGVTFLRSVQHEFSLLSLDMIFERFIVMRSFGALECRQFQHHYEGAFEGNRARNSLRCRWWHRAFARGHLLKISSAWVITLLSLDMIFERFIVMRSFGALECRQFQHHYEGAFEGNRARNSLRCRWWHRAFVRGHLLKISSAWV
jgi:hypothetical protein